MSRSRWDELLLGQATERFGKSAITGLCAFLIRCRYYLLIMPIYNVSGNFCDATQWFSLSFEYHTRRLFGSHNVSCHRSAPQYVRTGASNALYMITLRIAQASLIHAT
jgi:hypothetical protein